MGILRRRGRCGQLGETGIEMRMEGLGVGEVDGVGLMRVLADVGEMEAEGFAQPAEFDLAVVHKAELEHSVYDLPSCHER